MHPLRARLRRFLRSERGTISVWSLFLFMTAGAIGASAVDVTHFFAARTQLQVSADVAAHAALVRRNQRGVSAAQARLDAIAAVEYGMPDTVYGDVVRPADILFGTYDRATDTFRVDENSRSAVRVSAQRVDAIGNPVATFLFRFAGVGQMDVSTASVFETYTPTCLNGGFTANGLIDVQSNNSYYKGFCMHSNAHVELNSGNSFETGSIVSMPELGDFYANNQASTLDQNPGLEQALREDEYEIKILRTLGATSTEPMWNAILEPGNDYRPDYITSTTVKTISVTGNGTTLTQASFTPGQVHTATCNNGQRLTIEPASGSTAVYQNFVLLTNCEIQISGKVDLQNVVLYTTNTSSESVKVNSGGGGDVGLWLGKPDACAAGGAAQIITWGGFKSSAKLTVNGGQIIAMGDVNFAAQAEGVGASIIANGDIDGSSNMSFTGCTTGAEQNFTYPYYRMAR